MKRRRALKIIGRTRYAYILEESEHPDLSDLWVYFGDPNLRRIRRGDRCRVEQWIALAPEHLLKMGEETGCVTLRSKP